VRDPADGFFNGVLCNDATRCAGPRSTGIGQQAKVILSGSNAVVSQQDGSAFPATTHIATNSAQTFTFWVRDLHGNVMPGGTVVSLSASGGGLTVSNPSTFTTPCSAQPAGAKFSGTTLYSFTVTTSGTTGTGVVTLSVKTPSGLDNISQYSVAVP
jgi:hypothetical protein